MPLTLRSAGSYLLFGFCLEKCISTGHSSTRTKRKRGEQMEREQKTIRLPAELIKKLKQEADYRGYTMTDLILFILWSHVHLPIVPE